MLTLIKYGLIIACLNHLSIVSPQLKSLEESWEIPAKGQHWEVKNPIPYIPVQENCPQRGCKKQCRAENECLYGEIASIRIFICTMVSYSCLKVISSKNKENSDDQNGSLEQVVASRSFTTISRLCSLDSRKNEKSHQIY